MDALVGGPVRAEDAAVQIGADSSTTHRLLVVCATLDLVEEQPDGAFTLTSKGRMLADGSGSLKALAKLQVCDVGGGDGTFLFALLAANPQARGRVLDQAQVVEQMQDAPGSVRDRFSVVEGDFFADIPAADYYVLKKVLHDWLDDACLKVLQNYRRNAPDGARLVIVETMITPAETDTARLNTGAFLDMTVLTLVSGRERRQEELAMLLEHAGWAVTASVRVGTETTLLEAKPF